MPATTPPNSHRFLGSVSGPNRSGSSSATGRAPIDRMSRTIPPTPVAAPWYGSIADVCECDSILKTAASPPPRSTTPASSPGPTSTASPSVGSVFRWTLLDLYEQCSDHIAAYIASSVRFGARPRVRSMSESSSSLRPSARCSGSRSANGFQGVREEGLEQRLPPDRPDVRIDGVLRMRHEPDHVATLVAQACDVIGGAVRVEPIVELTV